MTLRGDWVFQLGGRGSQEQGLRRPDARDDNAKFCESLATPRAPVRVSQWLPECSVSNWDRTDTGYQSKDSTCIDTR